MRRVRAEDEVMNAAHSINTPLQRGGRTRAGDRNRFNGFSGVVKTVETVSTGWRTEDTSLKRGYLFSARVPRLRSADFQSAVSRISNPPALETSGVSEWSGGPPNGIRRYSRLEICATLNTYGWRRGSGRGGAFGWTAGNRPSPQSSPHSFVVGRGGKT